MVMTQEELDELMNSDLDLDVMNDEPHDESGTKKEGFVDEESNNLEKNYNVHSEKSWPPPPPNKS